MIDKLQKLEEQYDALTAQLASPEVIADSTRYQKTARAHAELQALVDEFRHFQQLQRQAADARQMLHEADAEMRQLANDEL
ncbi:MAG TPA: PCRF domain-containing protein, partial [Terriglobales bacterium]|nr:PCRF domain-containing protein [Terriglobales bacterium]